MLKIHIAMNKPALTSWQQCAEKLKFKARLSLRAEAGVLDCQNQPLLALSNRCPIPGFPLYHVQVIGYKSNSACSKKLPPELTLRRDTLSVKAIEKRCK
jgi:hypothetical protein